MNHDRSVTGIVPAYVLEVEALRKLEVELDGGHLMGPADRVARLDRDLRSIERAPTLIKDECQPGTLGHPPQRRLGDLPLLVSPHRLALRLGRQFEVEVIESELAEKIEDKAEQRLEF